jgi:hypothetical protein
MPDDVGPARCAAVETLRWDRRLFMTWDGDLAPCPAVIDVTGRERYLVFGPYRALEPGAWRAKVSLELCTETAQRPIAVQFGAEPDYTTVDLPRGVEGLHEVEIEHQMKSGDLAQIRVWLKRAAFHGELRFGGAEIYRIGRITKPFE